MAVFFVAPDLMTPLMALGPGGHGFMQEITSGQVNVEMFKDTMGKRWMYPEGKEMEGSGMSQDEAVIEFSYGSK